MIGRHIREHGIDLQLETTLEEILPDENRRVRAVVTNRGDEIPCQFVGLTTGVEPNVDFLHGSAIEINRGILVDNYFRTSVPDIFAIGDCAEFRERGLGRPRWNSCGIPAGCTARRSHELCAVNPRHTTGVSGSTAPNSSTSSIRPTVTFPAFPAKARVHSIGRRRTVARAGIRSVH